MIYFRISTNGEGNSCDILCDPGSIIGCKARININGCIPGLPADLAGNLFTCGRACCCCTSKNDFPLVNATTMKVICTITIQMLLFQGSVKIRMNQQTVVPRLPYNAILSAYVISISSSLVRLFQSKFLAVSEFNIRTTWWIPNKFNFFFLFFFFLFFQTILASAFVKKDYDRATTIASRVLQVCKYFDTSLPFFGSSTFSLFSSFLNCL